MHSISPPAHVSFMFVCVCAYFCDRVCVFWRLLELNVKPISKALIQLVAEIYSGAGNANL